LSKFTLSGLLSFMNIVISKNGV